MQLIQLLCTDMLTSFTTSRYMTLQIGSSAEGDITRRAVKSFEEYIDIRDLANLAFVTYYSYSVWNVRQPSPGELSCFCSVHQVYIVQKDVYLNEAFHISNIIHPSTLRSRWLNASVFLWEVFENF